MSHSIHLAVTPPRFVKQKSIRLAPKRREPTNAFTWPLETLGDRAPYVLRTHDGEHPSVDLGYAPRRGDRALIVPVLAANDGEVTCALESSTGAAISLDHGTWTTHYTGLSKLLVIPCCPRLRRRETVRAGQVIGYARTSPIHIGFELWRWTGARGFVPVAPASHMATWRNAPATRQAEAA